MEYRKDNIYKITKYIVYGILILAFGFMPFCVFNGLRKILALYDKIKGTHYLRSFNEGMDKIDSWLTRKATGLNYISYGDARSILESIGIDKLKTSGPIETGSYYKLAPQAGYTPVNINNYYYGVSQSDLMEMADRYSFG